MKRLFKFRRARTSHHLHLDTLAACPDPEGGFRVEVKGWTLFKGERVATHLRLEAGTVTAPCVALYRPDFMAVPGGQPEDHQLPGFRGEIRVPGGPIRLRLWGDDPEGRSVMLWEKQFDPATLVPPANPLSDLFSTFRFVRDLEGVPLAPRRPNLSRRDCVIDWIIPDFSRGAGGHVAIFRSIAALEAEGARCRIWIIRTSRHGSPAAIRQVIGEAFLPVNAEIRFLSPEDAALIDGDAGFATDRWTAYHLRAAPVGHRFYLVQDFEPSFYPAGAAYLLAENTYRFGFTTVVSSPWLAGLMRAYSATGVHLFNYGVDHQTYRPVPETSDLPGRESRHRIVFYSRANTERRAVEIGIVALEILAGRRSDFEVICFGESLGEVSLPFAVRDAGILSAAELAEVYREGTLGLVFSATNHAIIPKEMMACGLPVLELDGPSTRSVYPADVLAWTGPDPGEVADALEDLLDHPDRRQRLREAGLKFARGFEWDREIARITEAVFQSLEI